MNDRPQEQRPPTAAAAPDEQAAARVDRARTELRRGRAVRVIDREAADRTGAPAACIVVAADGLTPARWHWLSGLGQPVSLLLTAERARALGLQTGLTGQPAEGPLLLPLAPATGLEAVQTLSAVTQGLQSVESLQRLLAGLRPAPAESRAMNSALELTKQARLAPALLVVDAVAAIEARLAAADVLWVGCADVSAALRGRAARLHRVSDAQVPIAAHEDCKLVLFRDEQDDSEHVAIVVGQPDLTQPVPVRLHSSCFTGDLLGSLRCDCGDQLRRAIARLAETGGVLLYLEQEGRSTGLANKLRAYRLQDAGLDTIDADRYLGFLADERDYGAAIDMLRALGIARIRLMTNNPRKIAALEAGGIEVVDRIGLHGPVNPHNARYIETKQQRAGHLKGD